MAAADAALQRAHGYILEARGSGVSAEARANALDCARASLLDARRARAIPEQMHAVLAGICEVGIVDENPAARALVAQVVEELCLRDIKSFIIVCMPYLFRTLADHHVIVIKRGVRALTTLFRKVLGYIVSVGVGEAPPFFPAVKLHEWLEIQKKVVDLMDSPDAGIQKAATKFSETVILALSFSEGRASPEHFTLNYAAHRALNHPMLNLGQLEMEGKRCVSMVSGLIYAGFGIAPPPLPQSPRPYVPKSRVVPASLMTAVSVLGNLMKRRDKILDLTVPPLLLAVFAITGSRGPPSPVFLRLSEGEQRSIIMIVRLTLVAARAYPHTRSNADIGGAANEIWQFERTQKQERASAAARVGEQNAGIATGADATPSMQLVPTAGKRERAQDAPIPRPFIPANEALSFAQLIIRSMPPNEVAHFVMTRLLLDTPGDPNRARDPASGVPSVIEAPDPRLQKRPRKAESVEVMNAEQPDQRSMAPARRLVPVRRNAPLVVPLKLSEDGSLKLLYRCCKSILERERTAMASGAMPLRELVLAKHLAEIAFADTEMSRQLCESACSFVVDKIASRREFGLAWLHAVLCVDRTGRSPEDIEHSRQNLLLLSSQRADALASQNETSRVSGKEVTFGTLVKSEANVLSESSPVIESDDTPQEDTTGSAEAVVAPTVDNALAASTELDVEHLTDDEDEIVLQRSPVYEMLLSSILKKLMDSNAENGAHFARLIVDAPLIPKSIIDMLRDSCRDVTRNETGLEALRDIVIERCGEDRTQALDILLDLAVDSDEVIRGPSIRLVADKLFADMQGSVPSRIEKFAFQNLHATVEKLNTDSAVVTELERRAWLYVALCTQKHELLHNLAKCFVSANAEGKKVLLKHGKQLGGQLGTDSEYVVSLIRGKSGDRETESCGPDGVEEFALTILQGIIKKYGRPSEALVDAACARFRISGDARFLEAVLSGLSRKALEGFLGDLVKLSFAAAKVADGSDPQETDEESASATKSFKQMVRAIMAIQPPALSAAELLVALHDLEVSPAVFNAIQACFELKAIFKQGVVAQALQQLIGRTPVSPLLMNAVLLARTFHSDRERYLTETILVPLIRKKVWTNETLWSGFLRYCTEIKEPGKILLRLPAAQLDQAFSEKPSLLEVFRTHVAHPRFAKMIPAKHLKVIKTALLRENRTPA